MTIRPIVITGNPVLHRRAEAVNEITDEIRELVADMIETNAAAHGAGLAAPQVGVGLRIFVWALRNDDSVPEQGHVINPFVTSDRAPQGRPDRHDDSEGCLSVPGLHYPLLRGPRSHVRGIDLSGRSVEFTATGWFARAMQHEYDHLNGYLYVDRLDPMYARKARKAVKKQGWTGPGHSWTPGVDPDPFGHDADEDEEEDEEPL